MNIAGEVISVYCPENKTLWKKITRCNMCGKCCIVTKDFDLGVKSGKEVGWDKDIFVCKFLKKEIWHFEPWNGKTVYVCTNPSPPFGCCIGPSPHSCGAEFIKRTPECILEFEREILE